MSVARGNLARWGAAMLAVAAVWMAIDLPVFPIIAWDESRLAVNAIEMRHTGWSLVTTFGFRPDLWNTKPPLMIWAMNAAMAVFGPHEWALRLPSALATLGSAAIVMAFTWRLSRTALAPLAAGLILLASHRFVGRHCGQTADYDALLCFWVTAYGCLAFAALHRRRPGWGRVLLIGALVGAAGLTKGVAGVVPGAGIVLYLLLQRRWTRPVRSLRYVAGAVLAGAIIGGFYLLREAASPGYLHAVAVNEFGRYGAVLEAHDKPPWYYLSFIFATFGFSLGLLALPLLYAVRWLKGRRRAGAVFGGCMAAGIVAAYTLGATKLGHYTDPAYPFLAIACALGLEGLRERLRAHLRIPADAPRPRYERVVLWGAPAIMLIVVLAVRDIAPTFVDLRSQGRYGAMFGELQRQGIAGVEVRDKGLPNHQGDVEYAPQLQFYAVLWSERGFRAVRARPAAPWPRTGVVASCDPAMAPALARLGANLVRTPGCYAVSAR